MTPRRRLPLKRATKCCARCRPSRRQWNGCRQPIAAVKPGKAPPPVRRESRGRRRKEADSSKNSKPGLRTFLPPSSGCSSTQLGREGRLASDLSNAYVGRMKTMSTREFFHTPGLVKTLKPGESLTVTDKGRASFTVTKPGPRRSRTRAEMEREAQEICPDPGPTVNFTAALRLSKHK